MTTLYETDQRRQNATELASFTFAELGQLEEAADDAAHAERLAELAQAFDGWRAAARAELDAAENRGDVDDDARPGLPELRAALAPALRHNEGEPSADVPDLEPAERAALALGDRLAGLPSWGARGPGIQAELRDKLIVRLRKRKGGARMSSVFRLWHAIPDEPGRPRRPGVLQYLARLHPEPPAPEAPPAPEPPEGAPDGSPRMPLPAVDRIAALLSPALTPTAARAWFAEPGGVAWIDEGALAAVLKAIGQGGALATVAAHRLLRWLQARACEQMAAGAMLYGADWRVIEVEGGYTALADRMGISSAEERRRLGELLRLFDAIPLPLPDGSRGRLISLRWRAAKGRCKAYLSITIGDALLPTAVARELAGDLRHNRAARFLVPLPEALPPRTGRARDHAAQLSLQMAILAWMRREAGGMDGDGWIRIPERVWTHAAVDVGVPLKLLPRVIEAWCAGDDTAPPFLERDRAGRLRVVDALARASLIEGGERTREGEARARKPGNGRGSR